MKLILGPPGAGKTVSCLIQLKAALGAKLDSCRLIVPTATMAEHLRNELAREGFVFKPAIVSTFTKFTEPYCFATPAVTSGAIEILVKEVLARISLTTYAGVRDFAYPRAFERADGGAGYRYQGSGIRHQYQESGIGYQA